MRSAICILLSFMLLFTLSALDAPDNPRIAAWWGLLFPHLFAQPDGSEQAIFRWPLVMRIIHWIG